MTDRTRRLLTAWVPAHRVLCGVLLVAFGVRAVFPHQPWALIAAGTALDGINAALNVQLTLSLRPIPAPRTPAHPGGAEPGTCPICGQHDPDALTPDGWHESCMEWLGNSPTADRLRGAARRRQGGGWTSAEAVELLRAGLVTVNETRARVVQSGCAHVRVGDYAVWGGPTFRRCEDCGETLTVWAPARMLTDPKLITTIEGRPKKGKPGRLPSQGGYESGPLSIHDLPPFPDHMVQKPPPA